MENQDNTSKAILPVNLTPAAIAYVKNIMEEQDIPVDYGLRMGVKGGGCSGFSYEIGFDEARDGDDVFDIEGIKVLLTKTHTLHLLGIEVGWVDGLNNRGFSFNNPNATSSCGCGSSFST